MRGFPINAAGPRDPQTGFPIGGAGALINNTELRLPPPTLPYFGNSISFVLFHDMGNVFGNAGDAWVSAALAVTAPGGGQPRPTEFSFTSVAHEAGLTAPIVFGGVSANKFLLETTGTGAACPGQR